MRRDLRPVSAVCRRRRSTRVGATIVLSSRSAAATSAAVGRSRGSGCTAALDQSPVGVGRSGDELVQHDAERVDVRLGADLAPLGLLGRQVAERPEHRADLRDARLLDRAGDPEVGDLDDPVRGAQQVRRLQVAVHDPVRVCVREAGGDVGGCGPGQLPALERPAGQQLHDDARAARRARRCRRCAPGSGDGASRRCALRAGTAPGTRSSPARCEASTLSATGRSSCSCQPA